MADAEHIARALGNGRERQTSAGWRTFCPVHETDGGHSPSFDIDDKDGRILFVCRTGCQQSAVLDALRGRGFLNGNGNGNSKAARQGGKTRYEIRDADGVLKAVHVRVDKADGTDFKWERDGRVGLNGLKVASPLPLYGTERLRPRGRADCRRYRG